MKHLEPIGKQFILELFPEVKLYKPHSNNNLEKLRLDITENDTDVSSQYFKTRMRNLIGKLKIENFVSILNNNTQNLEFHIWYAKPNTQKVLITKFVIKDSEGSYLTKNSRNNLKFEQLAFASSGLKLYNTIEEAEEFIAKLLTTRPDYIYMVEKTYVSVKELK